MSIVALVTARGGSRAVPRKNLAPVGGRPLIAWTIAAALSARRLDRVLISTDDDEIARVGRECGAEVPFLRPASLAGDATPHVDVVLHALDWLSARGAEPDWLLTLQPTSPFRTAEDIDQAAALATASDTDAVVSVCLARDHPCLVKRREADGRLTDFVPFDLPYRRRQDLPEALALNGALYLNRTAALRRSREMVPPLAVPYIMPAERSLDVDEPFDLLVADLLMRHWRGGTREPGETHHA